MRRGGERAIAADEAKTEVRRCLREKLCSGVTEAALIEDEEIEPGEVRCDEGELLAQRSLRQTQRRADGEPVRLDVEEHKRAVVATAGEIEICNTTGEHREQFPLARLRCWPGAPLAACA